jgi:plastocyanin
LEIQQGDSVRFIMVAGGPHNVAFDPTALPVAVKTRLSANMPSQISELMGPMLLNVDETYTISFAGIPAGTYSYNCTPHQAMNQRGTIVVR